MYFYIKISTHLFHIKMKAKLDKNVSIWEEVDLFIYIIISLTLIDIICIY